MLIVLGAIIVGVAIFVGIKLFGADSVESNKDGITSTLISLASDAQGYKIRPRTLGGGRPSYVGYSIPQRLQSDDNGRYAINGAPSDNQIIFNGTSSLNAAWVAACTVDSLGKTSFVYNGWN
jgi:hypothetical protein